MLNKLLFTFTTLFFFSFSHTLLAQSGYVLFTAAGAINNTGATVITGAVGTGTMPINGFPPGIINGTTSLGDMTASSDVKTAYMNLSNPASCVVLDVGLGNGQVITPNTYCTGAASTIDGELIFDANNDPNAVFIVRIGGALASFANARITLRNGATCTNVIFQVNGAVELGVNSVFKGTIIANGALNFLLNASLVGKAFSIAGAINLNSNSITLGVAPVKPVATASGSAAICAGNSITLSGNNNGGTWNAGLDPTASSITVSTAGDYFITNSNACGTLTSNHIIVTVNPLPVCTITGGDLAVCPGTPTQLCAPSGNTKYQWSTTENTPCITVTTSGNYFVTVTDANGCSSSCNKLVVVNPLLVISSIIATPTTCGNNDGAILVTTNATTPIFTWSVAGVAGNNPKNLAAGNYSVTVTEGTTGCFAIATTTVSNSVRITASAAATPTTCGNNNGAILVTTNASTPTFTWSVAGVTGSNPKNLAAGNYSVTVTDGTTGCTAIATATIGNSVGITASAVSTPTACGVNSGTITVTTSSTTPTFTWNVAGVTGRNPINLPSGNYSVTVTDGVTGCTAIATAIIGNSSNITATATPTPTTCGLNNGAILVTTNASTPTFTWSVAGLTGSNPKNLAAGNYSVTVTDGVTSCTFIATATVDNSINITANAMATPTTCGNNNGSILVITNATSPIFVWSVAGVTGINPKNLPAGNYSVTVTDGNTSCFAIGTATIGNSVGINASASATPTACGINSGTITVTTNATNPTFTWNVVGVTGRNPTNLPAGNYSVTVTDGVTGCTAITSATIVNSSNITASALATPTTCGRNSGSILVTTNATNPTFTWNVVGVTGSNPINLPAGNYSVTVTDGTTMCSAIATAIIGNSNNITASAIATPTTCGRNSGSILVTTNATNPIFTWNVVGVTGSNPMILTAGNYSVTVTDGVTGCSFNIPLIVITSSTQNINCNITSNNPNPDCNNSSVQLCVSSSYTTYLWSTGARTNCINVNTPGNYSVTVTDANNCSSTCNKQINIGSNPIIPAIVAIGATTVCAGTRVTLTGNNNGGTWSTGETTPTITVTGSGEYFLTLTNSCGTVTSNKINIRTDLPPVPSVITANDSTTFCQGTRFILSAYSAEPWNTATWNTGSTTPNIIVTKSGDYFITNVNACGSVTSNHIVVKVLDLPNASAGNSTSICNGDSVKIGSVAIAGHTYKWTPSIGLSSDTVSNPVARPSVTTTYILTESINPASGTNTGCQNSNSVTITVSNPVCNITIIGTRCDGFPRQLCVPVGGLKYVWNTGETTNCISIDTQFRFSPINYSVSVTSANGCKSVCSKQIVDTLTSCTFGANISIATNPDCQGSASGVLIANALGGVAPYSYLWSNNYHEKMIERLIAGTYSVTISDKNCCTAVAQITIADALCENITDAGTISGDQTFCKQTDIQPITELTPASGGSGDIVYMWMYSTSEGEFNQSHYQLVPGSGNTKNLTVFPNVSVKTYFIRCVSRKGCCNFKESNIITKFPTVNTLILGERTFCVNTIVNFSTPTNGFDANYLWTATNATNTSSSARTFSTKFTSAGLQTVKVSVSKNGCVGDFTKLINAVNCQSASGSFFDFTVQIIDKNTTKESPTVALNWKTANETIASNYDVEHSDDGIDFYMMIKIPSQNNEINNYDFIYQDPKIGRNFFRIKHTEENGNVVFSDVRQSIIAPTRGEIITYPNPTANKLYVELLSASTQDGFIDVFNAIGKLMIHQNFESGQNRYEIDLNSFTPGTFILKITTADGATQTAKVSKL